MLKKLNENLKFIKLKEIISILIPLGFSIFNGILGLIKKSIWNGSIFFYYLLLLIVRFILVISNDHINENNINKRKIIYTISFVILLLINLSLIIPSILLINNQKEVNVGLIVSIAMATYSFYSISISIYNIKKYKNDKNLLLKQLKLVSFINAIVSIMVLQNTLIVVNGGYDDSMTILSIYSSIAFIILLAFLTIFSYVKNIKKN